MTGLTTTSFQSTSALGPNRRNEIFCSALTDALTDLYPTLPDHGTIQQQWEHVKHSIKKLARRFGPKHVSSWRTRRMKVLQRHRNRILCSNPSSSLAVLQELLYPIESKLTQLQNEIADLRQLLSGQRWSEKGEKCAGYIDRTIAIKQKAQMLDTLIHPDTQQECSTDELDTLDAANAYYQQMFSSDPVDDQAVTALTSCITPDQFLSPAHQDTLSSPIPHEVIAKQAERNSSRPTCPGPDGLTYGLISFVCRLPMYQTLIEQVYNEALTQGKFPFSWHESVMCLLYKKGDRSLLSQYLPLSMSNCDAKIFTRILNSRIAPIAATVLTSYQTSLIPSRFIGDNGVMLKAAMDLAKQRPNDHSIALLLDFMKAYDRVNSTYLRRALPSFYLPPYFSFLEYRFHPSFDMWLVFKSI